MTDEELLTEYLRTKDPDLLAKLYGRMRRRMYALAKRILRSHDDAEDIVQEVFCKLCELDPEPIQSAESFLYRIVQNLSLNRRRANSSGIREDMVSLSDMKRKAGKLVLDVMKNSPVSDDVIEEPIDERLGTVEESLQRQELWKEVETILDALPVEQREAIDAYYCRGMEVNEIAEMLALSPWTIRSRIRRGMDVLKEALRPDGLPMPVHRAAQRPSLTGEYANAV